MWEFHQDDDGTIRVIFQGDLLCRISELQFEALRDTVREFAPEMRPTNESGSDATNV